MLKLHRKVNLLMNFLGKAGGKKDGGLTSLRYSEYYSEETGDKSEERSKRYKELVNDYYDVVTDFYTYGWGDSFHFANRAHGESFQESLRRHEYFLAFKMGIKSSDTIIDLGCGIGGPMRAIARFTGAHVIGVNNNEYQIRRGTALNAAAGLSKNTSFIKADFHHLPVEDCSIDGVYTIEASCHSPDRLKLFSEIFRVLKPGGVFAGYEWTMTDNYDPSSKEHNRIKHDILEGDGLPDIGGYSSVSEALEKAGFVIEMQRDLVEDGSEIPWYEPLAANLSLSGFKHTYFGRIATSVLLYTLESLKLAPKGSYNTQQMLCKGADGLVRGGQKKIFTPMYFFLVRKPISKTEKH